MIQTPSTACIRLATHRPTQQAQQRKQLPRRGHVCIDSSRHGPPPLPSWLPVKEPLRDANMQLQPQTADTPLKPNQKGRAGPGTECCLLALPHMHRGGIARPEPPQDTQHSRSHVNVLARQSPQGVIRALTVPQLLKYTPGRLELPAVLPRHPC